MVTIPDIDVVEEIDHTEPSLAPPVMVPEPTPSRPAVLSLPSAYELESERKSSPPVLARRKELQTYVASFVGVAWFICLFAVGQTALRSIIVSVMR